ncbi:hypothetical protein ABZX51_000212 [Aspergillus tubingensis]
MRRGSYYFFHEEKQKHTSCQNQLIQGRGIPVQCNEVSVDLWRFIVELLMVVYRHGWSIGQVGPSHRLGCQQADNTAVSHNNPWENILSTTIKSDRRILSYKHG